MQINFLSAVAALSVLTHGVFVGAKVMSYSETALVQSLDEKPIPGNPRILQRHASEPQVLDLTNVTVVPDAPAPGSKFAVIVSGSLESDITAGAYATVDVNYRSTNVRSYYFDICLVIAISGRECPLKKGPLEISGMIEMPADFYPGQYDIAFSAFTSDDILITSLTHTIDISARSE